VCGNRRWVGRRLSGAPTGGALRDASAIRVPLWPDLRTQPRLADVTKRHTGVEKVSALVIPGVSVGQPASPAHDRAASGAHQKAGAGKAKPDVAAEVAQVVTGLHIVYRYKLPIAPAARFRPRGTGGASAPDHPCGEPGMFGSRKPAGVPDRPAPLRRAVRGPPTQDPPHHLLGRGDRREAADPSCSLGNAARFSAGRRCCSVGVRRPLLESAGGGRPECPPGNGLRW
jgi:hypothetical protein